MRRPPIKIVKLWIHNEIMNADAAGQFITVGPEEPLGAIREKLADVIHQDRLSMTDQDFRKKYINYIKRTAP